MDSPECFWLNIFKFPKAHSNLDFKKINSLLRMEHFQKATTREVEAGESKVQSHPWLSNESKGAFVAGDPVLYKQQ